MATFFVLVNVVFTLFLAHEYTALRQQIRRLELMQQTYKVCDEAFESPVKSDMSQHGDVGNDFVTLNRDPDHLAQTVLLPVKQKVDEKPRVSGDSKKKSHPKPHFSWPMESDKFWISSYYGMRRGRLHAGLDLAAYRGTPVMAAKDGVVIFADWAGKFGLMVLIKHDDGSYKTRYAHLYKACVDVGQRVSRGEKIGSVGNTGHVTGKNGYHLHFEILHNDEAVNPRQFLA